MLEMMLGLGMGLVVGNLKAKLFQSCLLRFHIYLEKHTIYICWLFCEEDKSNGSTGGRDRNHKLKIRLKIRHSLREKTNL